MAIEYRISVENFGYVVPHVEDVFYHREYKPLEWKCGGVGGKVLKSVESGRSWWKCRGGGVKVEKAV